MAKARSRTAARKVKDKWRAKNWYNILAPASFDGVTVAETLSDGPDNLISRVAEVSLQDITNDFRKSHIVLHFRINNVEENNAHTQFVGHSLTSDYLRRMIRRRKSKVDGVFDVTTKDQAVIRVKPFAITDKRIQNSQKSVIRESMKKTVSDEANKSTMSEFVKNIIDGKTGSDIYKSCKKIYPVKRVEINKTEVISQPTIEIKETKPKKKEEEKPVEEPKEDKKPAKKEKKTEEKKEEKKTEDKPKPKKEKKPKAKPVKKAPAKKKPAAKKAPVKKTPAKKAAKPKTAAKKTTTKKKTAKK